MARRLVAEIIEEAIKAGLCIGRVALLRIIVAVMISGDGKNWRGIKLVLELCRIIFADPIEVDDVA